MKPASFCLPCVAFTVALGLAIPLQAQTPPHVAGNQFSAEFIGGADPKTLLSLFEGTAPARSLLGLERGNLFMDFTNQRLRVDFMDLDGTAQTSYLISYGKRLEYVLDLSHRTCQVIPLAPDATLQPFFGWLPSATLASSKEAVLPANPSYGTEVITLDTWEYLPPHGSGFTEIGLTAVADPSNMPISVFWRLNHPGFPIEVNFESFSGTVNAGAFSVPSYCSS